MAIERIVDTSSHDGDDSEEQRIEVESASAEVLLSMSARKD